MVAVLICRMLLLFMRMLRCKHAGCHCLAWPSQLPYGCIYVGDSQAIAWSSIAAMQV